MNNLEGNSESQLRFGITLNSQAPELLKKKILFAEMVIYLIPGSLGSWNALAVKNECASGQR